MPMRQHEPCLCCEVTKLVGGFPPKYCSVTCFQGVCGCCIPFPQLRFILSDLFVFVWPTRIGPLRAGYSCTGVHASSLQVYTFGELGILRTLYLKGYDCYSHLLGPVTTAHTACCSPLTLSRGKRRHRTKDSQSHFSEIQTYTYDDLSG